MTAKRDPENSDEQRQGFTFVPLEDGLTDDEFDLFLRAIYEARAHDMDRILCFEFDDEQPGDWRQQVAKKTIGLADAKAHFSEVVDEVLHHDARYVIERRGKPVAALISLEELERLEREADDKDRPTGFHFIPSPDGFTDEEVDNMLKVIYEERERDMGRAIDLER